MCQSGIFTIVGQVHCTIGVVVSFWNVHINGGFWSRVVIKPVYVCPAKFIKKGIVFRAFNKHPVFALTSWIVFHFIPSKISVLIYNACPKDHAVVWSSCKSSRNILL